MTSKKEENHLYLKIASVLEHQIIKQVVKVGDRLPSVRSLSKEQGVSISTALQTYYFLESKGLIEARPQSGYYVSYAPRKFPAVPEKTNPAHKAYDANPEDIIADVYDNLTDETVIRFSLSVPSPKLLPLAKLTKAMHEAMRDLPANGTNYENIQGNEKLRKQIARWSLLWEGKLTEDDIITTSGCMNALVYALMAITKHGDTIAVESPVYFGVLQVASSLGLKVLELPSDSQTGVDVDALKKALEKGNIKACLFVSNFNNPMGSCIPDEHKKEIVRLLEKYNVPLVEDDLYGDVHFSKRRPKSCKSYDESGIVLWCASVSKSLAPGYRVGWIAPGKFLEQIRRMKLYHAVSSPTLQQEAIARFLENGRYEHHLRKLRHVLHANSLHTLRAIGEYFPDGLKVSRPQGGFILWVELDKKIDCFKLYQEAIKYNISIAPGRMFTLQDQFKNCMRLSYGMLWQPKVEEAMKKLGDTVKKMMV